MNQGAASKSSHETEKHCDAPGTKLPAQEIDELPPEEMRRVLKDLQSRQRELEAQNEELRRAQSSLWESNELLSLFMRHSPIYAFIKVVTPTESRVLKASENFRDMIGIPGSQMNGKTMQELFQPEFAAKIAADDWTVVASGNVLRLDEDLNGRNYTTIKFPIDLGGRHLLAGYTIDITDRKQAESERIKLEAQNRQLQKSESLGRMAGAIAHHFNNQLQAVMMSLQLAKTDLPLHTESAQYIEDALQAATKASQVGSQMLTYLGKNITKREPLDLSDACLRSLPMLRAAMPHNVTIESAFPKPGPAIQSNTDQMQQVLANLVTNAWEAVGEEKSIIRLSIKTVAAVDIPVENRFPIGFQPKAAAYACLEVEDAGCGIAEKDVDKLFDPFYTSKFTGRGLGLSVVLGIVRARHGVVTVKSRLGQGSVFRVFLPMSDESPAGLNGADELKPNASTV